MYAVDSQVYVSTPADDATAALAHLSAANADINDWMKASRLRPNPSKTQVMWLGTKQQLDKIVIKDVPLLSTVVTVVDSACDLGVIIIIDSQLSKGCAHCRSLATCYYCRKLQLDVIVIYMSPMALPVNMHTLTCLKCIMRQKMYHMGQPLQHSGPNTFVASGLEWVNAVCERRI